MGTFWRRGMGLRRAFGAAALASSVACVSGNNHGSRPLPEEPEPQPETEQDRAAERAAMVDAQIAARGVRSPEVLAALRSVPRHEFVPAAEREAAYADHPLPIGFDQTISQPYIVALMTELARLGPTDRVLEIGTGSGYQAAVLARMVKAVYSIEIIEPLARSAAVTLARLRYTNVQVRAGDGYQGWPAQAPFDAILVTAAPARVPEPLKQQLAPGGRLVIPVGTSDQELLVLTRRDHGFETERVLPVRFVPMTGAAQRR
jgi:protein-L-isoaspartate(D-aspartate) O-methyltransferase